MTNVWSRFPNAFRKSTERALTDQFPEDSSICAIYSHNSQVRGQSIEFSVPQTGYCSNSSQFAARSNCHAMKDSMMLIRMEESEIWRRSSSMDLAGLASCTAWVGLHLLASRWRAASLA